MLKSLLAFTLCFAFASNGRADRQTPPPSAEETAAALDEGTANTEKLVAEAKTRADAAKAAKDALQKPYLAAKKKYDESKCTGLCFGEGTGNDTFAKELAAAKLLYDDAKKASDDAEKEVRALNKKAYGMARRAKDQRATVDEANKKFMSILQSQSVTTDFLMLKNQLGDTDKALDKMSAFYDKTMMGAYVKDKVGLLLNSQLICQARRRCDVKEPAIIPNSDIENVLFPKTGDSTRNQQYYNKANPGKRSEGTTN